MRFTDPAAVRAEFPTLDTSASLKLEEFERVVGETAFPKIHYAECQLLRISGRECRSRFGDGAVILRKDGVVLYIGGDCVERHIQEGSEIGQRVADELELMRRRNRIAELRRRIAERHTDAQYAAQLKADWGRCIALRKRLYAERASIPGLVLDRLSDLRKRGRRDVPAVALEVEQYVDRNGDQQTRIKRHPISLGIVANPEGIEVGAVESLEETMRLADSARRRALPDDFPFENDLIALLQQLDAVVGAASMLDDAEDALTKFLRPENLRAVSWLASRAADQERVVAQVLSAVGHSPRPERVRATIEQWSAEIRAANGGRDFEPIS